MKRTVDDEGGRAYLQGAFPFALLAIGNNSAFGQTMGICSIFAFGQVVGMGSPLGFES
jgi:hypothetical protein